LKKSSIGDALERARLKKLYRVKAGERVEGNARSLLEDGREKNREGERPVRKREIARKNKEKGSDLFREAESTKRIFSVEKESRSLGIEREWTG